MVKTRNPDTEGKRGEEMEGRQGDTERQRISFSDERK